MNSDCIEQLRLKWEEHQRRNLPSYLEDLKEEMENLDTFVAGLVASYLQTRKIDESILKRIVADLPKTREMIDSYVTDSPEQERIRLEYIDEFNRIAGMARNLLDCIDR